MPPRGVNNAEAQGSGPKFLHSTFLHTKFLHLNFLRLKVLRLKVPALKVTPTSRFPHSNSLHWKFLRLTVPTLKFHTLSVSTTRSSYTHQSAYDSKFRSFLDSKFLRLEAPTIQSSYIQGSFVWKFLRLKIQLKFPKSSDTHTLPMKRSSYDSKLPWPKILRLKFIIRKVPNTQSS